MRKVLSNLVLLVTTLPVISQALNLSEYLTTTYTQAYLENRWAAELLTTSRIALDIYRQIKSRS